jgi:hypothetical protein
MKLMPALSLEPASNDAQRKKNGDRFRTLFQEVLKDSGFEPDEPMLDKDGANVYVHQRTSSLIHSSVH